MSHTHRWRLNKANNSYDQEVLDIKSGKWKPVSCLPLVGKYGTHKCGGDITAIDDGIYGHRVCFKCGAEV